MTTNPPDVPLTDHTAHQTDLQREKARAFDSRLNAMSARLSAGLSPISAATAWLEWGMTAASQPAEVTRLLLDGQRKMVEGMSASLTSNSPPVDGFGHPKWQTWPWAPTVASWQAARDWWQQASQLQGMSPHAQEMVRFMGSQWLDMLSPANAGLLNPEVLERTREQRGQNLVDGARNAIDEWRWEHGLPSRQSAQEGYRPGIEVACTPGKVVHRNRLAELIQYLPTTERVDAQPVFIVPSWIMKYYILDLSPHNSMVKWLVSQGHTVFILSWRNPDESDAGLGMADYLEHGVFDMLAAIARLVPKESVHACGYCLGGTLVSIAAAALSRPGKVSAAAPLAPLASVTLLAAETDFSEPGELGVLIDEPQVRLLEDMMAERGFLTGRQMGGSFAYLHSRDLVWSRRMHAFWLGESDQPNDLMAWNADVTRMPAAMHSEYLRRCYLHNELAQSRFPVQGRPVSLSDVKLPSFVVGTEKDHVSPWKSVYKIHLLSPAEITFVLTSGGHNAGIVSEPGHAHRHYALHTRPAGGAWLAPGEWRRAAVRSEGSWWPAWSEWMRRQGDGQQVKARVPKAAEVLCDAPGENVHVRYND